MISEVEGDWKQITFKLANESDIKDINSHLRESFLRDETWNKYLGWCDKKAEDYERITEVLVKEHGISLVARHNASGELAAVQLVVDTRKQEESLKRVIQNMSTLGQTIMKLIETIEDSTREVFNTKFPCSFYADIMISSVERKYRGIGLGLEIYQRTLKLLQFKGFPVARSTFTSPGTRAIGKKLGFTTLGTFYLKYHVNEAGQRIFPDSKEDDFSVDVAKSLL